MGIFSAIKKWFDGMVKKAKDDAKQAIIHHIEDMDPKSFDAEDVFEYAYNYHHKNFNGSIDYHPLSRYFSILGKDESKKIFCNTWTSIAKRTQENLALTCNRCHAIALPIPGSERNYECQKCGRRFTGTRHGF